MPTILKATANDLAYFAANPYIKDDGIKRRIVMERAVMRMACEALVAAGFELRVWDGGAWAGERTADVAQVLEQTHACDEEMVYVFKLDAETDKWRKFGYLLLVYGNAGYEVIADYTVNLETELKATNDYSDGLYDAVVEL